MARIFSARLGQPSPFAMAVATVLAVTLGLLFWVLILVLTGHDIPSPPIPRPRPEHSSSLTPDPPMKRLVKTIEVGPDPLAEPDPLKPYRVPEQGAIE